MNIPQRILMGPGPSTVPARVLEALSRPTIGHLDPVFLQLMDQVRANLRRLFKTDNDLTLAIPGTGSAGMETAFVNLLEPGDKLLVCINGVFGQRMKDVAERCGAEVKVMERPWGQAFEPDDLRRSLERMWANNEFRPDLLAIVHAETSTGVCNPLDGLADLLHEHNCLLLMDCVTSLGGMPVFVDGWGVDVAYSGTQKCLSCPPGVSPVTLGPRALEKLDRRKRKVQSWYLDLQMIRNYWGQERFYHHTAPINMLYALAEALEIVFEEGLENRWDRHRILHLLLKEGLAELGIRYSSDPRHTLPMLNAVEIPAGVEDAPTRRRLLDEYGIEIGGGLGAGKGKDWRIGLMGESCSKANVTLLLGALKDVLAPATMRG